MNATVQDRTESKAAAKVTRRAGVAEARIAERDAESARRLRERQAELELRRQESEIERLEREAKSADRETKRGRRIEQRRAKRRARTERATAAASRVYVFVAGNAPAVYSSIIYAMALAVAVSGQISVATERGWPLIFGIGMAVFLEGLALSMALTAHQLRLRNERALIPAAMTWIAAGFASAINVLAHRDDPILAAVLGASSLAAIIVWEVRSGAKHRAALRAKGWLPEPPERFGLRRWLRYPRSTWRAWSLDVRDRVSDGAAVLLARVEEARDAAAAERAGQAAQWGALHVALAAVQDAASARAIAADAVKTAARVRKTPRWRRRPVADPEPVPRKEPSAKPKPAKKTEKPAKRTVPSVGFEGVEEAFVRLFAETGKRPGVRALEEAVQGTDGAKKKSAIHTWMKRNPDRVEALTVRAEQIRGASA